MKTFFFLLYVLAERSTYRPMPEGRGEMKGRDTSPSDNRNESRHLRQIKFFKQYNN